MIYKTRLFILDVTARFHNPLINSFIRFFLIYPYRPWEKENFLIALTFTSTLVSNIKEYWKYEKREKWEGQN